jgi:hypothetical protein
MGHGETWATNQLALLVLMLFVGPLGSQSVRKWFRLPEPVECTTTS